MNTGAFGLTGFGYAVAALTYGAFAIYLLRSGQLGGSSGKAANAFVAAVLAGAMWATAGLLDLFTSGTTSAYVFSALELLRYALWFAFLLLLLRPRLGSSSWRNAGALAWVAMGTLAVAGLSLAWRVAQGQYAIDASTLGVATALTLAILGILLTEQLFRNLSDDSRWNAKPVCLALACAFTFDVYLYSEALLFGRFDRDAHSIRGFVHAMSVPLLWLAATRRGDLINSLKVSRTAAFHSTTLVLAGAYMLFMSVIGYYVRYFGGEWGRALQLGVVFFGTLTLVMLAVSGSMRARLRVFVGKHFFSYRYDYRHEWLRVTAMLSTQSSPQEVGGLVIRAMADMVECPGGDLWTCVGQDQTFSQTARWNAPQCLQAEPRSSAFSAFLRSKAWVVDLDDSRRFPAKTGLVLPDWLHGNENAWLVIPLIAGDELLGFVTLVRPRAAMELNWEVLDLLKTASRQAAGFMAQMQATEALLEARKFDAFNRMSAFVVHDLKNIVTQLSLMLKNAERLHANPEFQQDMLLTVGSSLEKMKRLMLQLREGAKPPGGTHGVELTPIVTRLEASALARGRKVDIRIHERLATRGHEDRLERVLGHLLQNAFDATPSEGEVWLHVSRSGGQVQVEVGDTGAGMSEEFVNTQLFRPFNSTKQDGMGIGAFESAQYVRELGGAITVQSQPGKGSVVRVVLPLFDAQHGSDLQMHNAR